MKRFLKWAAARRRGRRRLRTSSRSCTSSRRSSSTPPETFGKAMADAAPAVTDIADPAERAIAERGRYIVMTTGCIGCHATNGSQGPDLYEVPRRRRLENPDAARRRSSAATSRPTRKPASAAAPTTR